MLRNMEISDFKQLSVDEILELLDYTLSCLFITDRNGKVLYVNQPTAKSFGLEKEEIISRDSGDLVAKSVINTCNSLKAIAEKRIIIGNSKTGIGVDLYNISKPVLDENGELMYVVTCGYDRETMEYFLETLESERRTLEVYKNTLAYYTQKNIDEGRIVLKSKVMKDLFKYLGTISRTDSAIILNGESGVGKDVVANYIHDNSLRSDAPFIPINCAAIPPELMESEFFGYERGAFTGAGNSGKPGFFELANNGTLFLDEVAELPKSLQTKLLRVLENREVMRLGGVKKIKVNTRLISATNRNLERMVIKKQFREDLYFRINVIPITIPPLRERVDDIEPLANLFLDQYNKKYSTKKRFSRDIMAMMKKEAWPGNIRELKNFVERVTISAESNLISAKTIKTMNIFGRQITDRDDDDTVAEQKPIHHAQQQAKPQTDTPSTLNSLFSNMQKDRVLDAMMRANGNKCVAAKLLGISRGKLYRMLNALDAG